MELIGAVAPAKDSRIVDIGGGASRLVDCLLEDGYEHLTVVDVSEAALQAARERLGVRAESVTWRAADVRNLRLPEEVDVWHDRAVFHFLTSEGDRARYKDRLSSVLKPGGSAIIATFALEGPEKCSGLPVARYSAESLASELGDQFALVDARRHLHTTPWGATQAFQYSRFTRT